MVSAEEISTKNEKRLDCYICGSKLTELGTKTDKDGRTCSYKSCPHCGNEEHWYD